MVVAARLVHVLEDPACYLHATGKMELLETHISWVLLTGDYAYKIKKPVDFGFVDFSTLDRRRFFCEEELRLNGRLAEGLYLAVVPITGTPEQPRIGGIGDILEYAVKMRQFSQAGLLNQAIEDGTLQPEHIDQLAQEIADFHGRIAVATSKGDTAQFGTREKILGAVWANFRALLEQDIDPEGQPQGECPLPEVFQPSITQLHQLLDWTRTQAARLMPRFEDRRNQGAVRECHGDMHLGNMLLEEGEILIFDGIEFNANLRWIDVISEVAFCVMDLQDRHRPDFAHRLLNSYLEHTGDYGGLDLLPFYRTYRALVRAKVAHLGWKQHDETEPETRRKLAAQRQEYLDLAVQFTQPGQPMLYITHGLSGSGKSYGTQPLIEEFGAIRVRSDVERKRLAGLDRLANSQLGLGENLYSANSTAATYRRLAECAEQIIAAGFPAILDATFLKADQRAAMQTLADRLQVPFIILDFQADENQLRERIVNRLQAGTDPSEADVQVLENQIRNRELLTPNEQTLAISINTAEPDFTKKLLEAIPIKPR